MNKEKYTRGVCIDIYGREVPYCSGLNCQHDAKAAPVNKDIEEMMHDIDDKLFKKDDALFNRAGENVSAEVLAIIKQALTKAQESEREKIVNHFIEISDELCDENHCSELMKVNLKSALK